jgi:hypothetical protein
MTPAQAASALSFQSIAALRRLAAGKRPYPKQRTKLAKTGCMAGDFITPFGRAVLAECDAINQGSKAWPSIGMNPQSTISRPIGKTA